jgi:hypothetical protein
MEAAATAHQPTLSIRVPDESDTASLRTLASRAATEAPRGHVMLAEVDGETIAAVALAEGKPIEDPARSTPALLAVLRLRRLEARFLGALWA